MGVDPTGRTGPRIAGQREWCDDNGKWHRVDTVGPSQEAIDELDRALAGELELPDMSHTVTRPSVSKTYRPPLTTVSAPIGETDSQEPTDDPLADWVTPVDWPTFWATNHPDEDWLIQPVIPAGRQVAIYSPAKAGKSLLALDMAASLAAGSPLLGEPNPQPRSVVYIDLEMTEDDVRERLEDLGYGPDSVLDHLHYYLLPSLPPLDTDLGGQIVAAIATRYQAALVVIDTMARAVRGEENDADTYRDYYTHTGKRLKQQRVAMLRLDHAGKELTQGQRGSSAKADDVDVVFKLAHVDTGVILKRTHTRVPWVPDEIHLARHANPLSHTLTDGLWPAETVEVANLLTELAVPLDATTRAAQTALRQAGHGRRRQIVVAALKWRTR